MSTFNPLTGPSNPFAGISVANYSAPIFGDIDGDGDLDLVLGQGRGVLLYYRNTGTAIAPAYAEQTGAANPFNGFAAQGTLAPSLGDIDGDGDLDVVAGESFGTLIFYRNTGTATAPAYAARTGGANPFDGLIAGQYSTPSLGDIDGDGDLDLVVGQESLGVLNFYRNTGTATAPAYVKQTGSANPFSGIAGPNATAPRLGDIDGDGDLDLVLGDSTGVLRDYRNTGTATAPAYAEQTGAANPFDGIDVGAYSAPGLGDIDGDNDLDLVAGNIAGKLQTFQNPATATPPVYVALTDASSPFSAINVGFACAPNLGDIDGDGDLDLVLGEPFGTLNFHRNTGTATTPAYAEQTGAANPFDGIDVGFQSDPSLGDIDGDGDLDLVVGESAGTLLYHRNTGTATAPAYAEQTGAANPFNGLYVGSAVAPSLGDIDGDGDLDLVAGIFDGTLKYYRNTGTATAPAYAEQTGAASPFNGFDVGDNSIPSLGDIDGDGDLDLIVGDSFGTVATFIHNDAPTLRQATTNLAGTNEDTTSTPVTVASLLASAGQGDVDLGALQGLAVIGSTGAGSWQYSVGGSTWTPLGTTSASAAVLLGATTQLRYVPDGANGGTASLSFRAWDQTSGGTSTDGSSSTADTSSNGGGTAFSSTSSTASLAVAAINDAPTHTVPGSIGVTEDLASALTGISVADDDAGSSPLVMTLSVPAGTLTATSGSGVTVGGSATATLTLTGTASAISSFIAASQVSYTTASNANGTVLLTVSTNDQGATGSGGALTDTDTVNLDITAVNDAPTTTPLTLPAINEDTSFTITQATLLADTADIDGPNPLQAVNLQIATGLGSLTSPTPGTWVYTPAPNDDTQVSFKFGVTDGLDTTPGSATLDILPVNDPPVAVADLAQASAVSGAVNIAVLANDSDVDGGPLTVSAITQGSSGSVSIRPDGVSVRYVPNPGFSGFDTFTYTANDGAGGTAVGTVRVLTPSYVGTSGNDVPLGTPQADFIVSGDGNDRVLAYGGDDFVDGGRGLDTVSGGLGNDTLIGGDGADTFLTTAAELAGDSIDGGDAIDTLQITDPIAVMPAAFTLVNVEQLSFPGSLQVGHTSLLDLSALTLSGTGNQINGGTAATRITGTRSNDRITDSAGNDDLRGGEGHDTIMAGVGQDTVYGGRGNDTLGGSSSTLGDGSVDTFVFNTALNALTNVDTVIGFEATSRDVIALDSGIFSAIGATLDAGELLAVAGGLAVDANDFILYDTTTGALYYDADGSGAGVRVPFATLGAGLTGTVDASDFTVGSFPG